MPNTHSLDLELSSSQYATRADTASLSLTSDLSIEAWVKIEQLPSTAASLFTICAKGSSGDSNASWLFYIGSDDKLNLIIYEAGTDVGDRTIVTSDAVVVASGDVGAWVHFAVTFLASGPTVVMYKNGSSVASTASASAATSIHDGDGTIAIGAVKASGSALHFFDGLVDEYRIWSDVRTGGEISGNYLKELNGDEGNLVAYWKLNNDYEDSTTNNNDLTAAGSPVFSADVPFTGAFDTSRFYFM